MKHKVGDRVKVRSDLEAGKEYGKQRFNYPMSCFRGKIVTICNVGHAGYGVKENTFDWSDEMFEPVEEMSAEEAIKSFADMCTNYSICAICPIHEIKGKMRCIELMKSHPEKVLEILKQRKAEHEKKPIETEFVNVVRVIENTGVMKKCVYEERLPEGELNLSEKQSEVLRKYCEEHKGKYFSVVERICAVKE